MLNLLITYDSTAWNDGKSVLMDSERCLREYISQELQNQYSGLSRESIEELKRIPCIFAYEKVHKLDAYIGYIRSITVSFGKVRIDYELTDKRITFDDLMKLTDQLCMDTWEWNRTHWTLKDVNLDDLELYLKKKNFDNSKVFISYSWTPPSNQENVFELIHKLEADGINVVYDNKDLYPGQDINYFMENVLTSDQIDAVIIVCNKDYAQKANKRIGGTGYESELILSEIRGNPKQIKYIPVVIEHDENGKLPLPNFLKSRLYVDLSESAGYDKLLDAIKRNLTTKMKEVVDK